MYIASLEKIDKINKNFNENIVKTAIVFSIVATVYILSGDIFLSIIIGFALGVVIIGWDSRVFVAFGLIFLIFCPFLLAFEKKALAEEMAVNAYYMLALGVILQIIQHFKESIFSRNKSIKESEHKPAELWSKKMQKLFILGTACSVLIVVVGLFTFFYLKIDSRLNENDKLIKSLIDSHLTDNSQVAGETTGTSQVVSDNSLRDEIVTDNVDPKNFTISIVNTTKQEGLESKFSEAFKKLGFSNINIAKADLPLEQGTLIQYCTNCFDTVQELSLALHNQTDLLIIEDPELSAEITVSLGIDQMYIDNSEISISILNGSKVSGAAKGLQTKMIGDGFNVTNYGTADKTTYQNTIIKYSLINLEKANIVKEYLSASYNNIEMLEVTKLQTDIEIVLGKP